MEEAGKAESLVQNGDGRREKLLDGGDGGILVDFRHSRNRDDPRNVVKHGNFVDQDRLIGRKVETEVPESVKLLEQHGEIGGTALFHGMRRDATRFIERPDHLRVTPFPQFYENVPDAVNSEHAAQHGGQRRHERHYSSTDFLRGFLPPCACTAS